MKLVNLSTINTHSFLQKPIRAMDKFFLNLITHIISLIIQIINSINQIKIFLIKVWFL